MVLVMKITTLDPRDCTRWKYADRSSFEFGDTNGLADDIRVNGQINPIFVRALNNNANFKYEVIAGSRRLQACQIANLPIKAIVVEATDTQAATIQIKENDKLALSEFSKGLNFSKLRKNSTITQEQLAEIVGCSRRKIQSLLSFAQVDIKIWNAVNNMTKVSAKSAETILAISNKSKQHKEALIEIAEELRKGAGHRRIEKMVNSIVSGETQGSNEELVESPSGQVLAKWKDGKLYFAKGIEVNKAKLNVVLINFFNARD